MARTSPREQSGYSLQALPVFWRDFLELEITHSIPDLRGGREDETQLTPHRVNKDTGRENTRHSALKGKDNPNYWTSCDEDNRKGQKFRTPPIFDVSRHLPYLFRACLKCHSVMALTHVSLQSQYRHIRDFPAVSPIILPGNLSRQRNTPWKKQPLHYQSVVSHQITVERY